MLRLNNIKRVSKKLFLYSLFVCHEIQATILVGNMEYILCTVVKNYITAPLSSSDPWSLEADGIPRYCINDEHKGTKVQNLKTNPSLFISLSPPPSLFLYTPHQTPTYIKVEVVLEVAEQATNKSSQVDDMGRLHPVKQSFRRNTVSVQGQKNIYKK